MADNPDYSAGTVSATTGTKTITGVGTLWASAGLLAGDTFGSDGHPRARIASINSNTSITLMDNWRGPTLAAGSSYWIRYQADGSRYAAILGEVRRMISGSASLASLAGLPGGANKLPFFNGVASMDQTDLTPFARTLLDDANAATALGTLGLTDAEAHRMMLATSGTYVSGGSDLNTLVPGDFGLYSNSNANTPTRAGVAFWWIQTQRVYTNTAVRQTATGYYGAGANKAVIFERGRAGDGTWGPWEEITLESGSNANGTYVRFGDGTQICTSPTFLVDTNNASGPALFISAATSWTFPAAFIAAPFTDASAISSASAWGNAVSATTTTTGVRAINTVSTTGVAVRASAIGRWKA